MSLRRPAEEEHLYIRKHVRKECMTSMFFLLFGVAICVLSIVMCINVIITQHKGFGFIILSGIVQVFIIVFGIGLILLIKDEITKIILASREKYFVQNCAVTDIHIIRRGKSSITMLTVQRDDGTGMNIKASSMFSRKFHIEDKGIIVFFKQEEDGTGGTDATPAEGESGKNRKKAKLDSMIFHAKDIYKE